MFIFDIMNVKKIDISNLAKGYTRSFSLAFQNKNFVIMAFLTMVCVFLFHCLNMIFSINLADQGLIEVMTYLLISMGGMAFLFMPFMFWLLPRLKPYMFMVLYTAFPVLGVLFIGFDVFSSYGFYAVLLSLCIGAKWSVVHSVFSVILSDNYRAHETSVMVLGNTLASIFGVLLGGWMSMSSSVQFYILICFAGFAGALMMIALFVLHKKLPLFEKSNRFEVLDLWTVMKQRPDLAKGTVFQGFFTLASGSLMPIWLKLMGVTGLGVGGLMAAKVTLQSFISPIVAKLSHVNFWKSVRIGFAFNVTGWVPWLVMSNPFTMLVSSIFWSTGEYLYGVGLDTQWYGQRRVVAMAAREMLLGVGRIVCTVIMVPILYLAYKFFAVAGLMFAILALLQLLRQFAVVDTKYAAE